MQDVVKQITGFLTALLLFLGTLNVKFEWFNMDTINSFEVVLVAGAALLYSLWRIYKNHYGFSQKAKAQDEALKRQKLK